MSQATRTVKARLVIVVGPYESSDRLARDLKELGARGFTLMRVDGYGAYGPRKYGLSDGANVRFEVVATPDLAGKILEHIVTHFEDQPVTGYAVDCEAVHLNHITWTRRSTL